MDSSRKKNISTKLVFLTYCLLIFVFTIGFYTIRSGEKVRLVIQDQAFRTIQANLANAQNDEALQALDSYYPEELYKNNDVIWYLKGWAWFGKRDYAASVRMFEKALENNVLLMRSYDFLYLYGFSLYANNNKEKAYKIMETAILISPKNAKNYALSQVLQEYEHGSR